MVNTKPKTRTTTKKMKIIGYEQRINPATGEIQDVQVINHEDRDFNFNKVWLGHIVHALDLIGNKKIKVLNYLFENKNYENIVIATMDQMAQKTSTSKKTVYEVIKILRENDIMTKINNAVYRLNPDVVFKGGMKHRMNILIQYRKEKQAEPKLDVEELLIQLERVEKTDKKIREQLTKIGYSPERSGSKR